LPTLPELDSKQIEMTPNNAVEATGYRRLTADVQIKKGDRMSSLAFIFFNIGPSELLIVLLIMIGPIIWLRSLIDCLMNEPSEGNDKIVWLLIIIFLSLLGALLYLTVRRPTRIKKYGK